jgi:hypothetical protein
MGITAVDPFLNSEVYAVSHSLNRAKIYYKMIVCKMSIEINIVELSLKVRD